MRSNTLSSALLFCSATILIFCPIFRLQAESPECVSHIENENITCTTIRGFNQGGLRAFLEQFLLRDIPRKNLNSRSPSEPVEGSGFSLEHGPAPGVFDLDLESSGIIAYRFAEARSIFRDFIDRRQDVNFYSFDACDLYYLKTLRKYIIIFDDGSGLSQISACSKKAYYKMSNKIKFGVD